MKGIQLLAGAAVTDITPPLEVGLLTSAVKGEYAAFTSVRLPLKARVLVLKSGENQVAIVSMDLLSLNDTSVGGWDNFKQGLAEQIVPENIIITYTHTHCAPESGAVSPLYLTEEFRTWLKNVQIKVREAIREAGSVLKPCTVEIACQVLEGYSLQRRIKKNNVVVMSDSLQPIPPDLMDGQPIDRRVYTISFLNDKNTIATLVQAACHPVHEMCMRHVSSDFPGEMCRRLEANGSFGMPMFLNGAAGDVNPPTVSLGPIYSKQHGYALADLVERAHTKIYTGDSPFSFATCQQQFAIRKHSGVSNSADGIARISVIGLGKIALVFLPGEPFTETALQIEHASPFEHTIIIGFSENNIGYIPTAEAFREGGYEVGPGKWSFIQEDAHQVVQARAAGLLKDLYQQP
jgi:neutral ceramidase